MLHVKVEYQKDANGYITDAFCNTYADTLAGGIIRNNELSPQCGHTKYPAAVIHLAVDSSEDKVYIREITNFCCNAYKEFLDANLERIIRF